MGIHAACEVLSWFELETRIPLHGVSLCDCLEPIIDDFIRPECCKRQSNVYLKQKRKSVRHQIGSMTDVGKQETKKKLLGRGGTGTGLSLHEKDLYRQEMNTQILEGGGSNGR